MGPKICRNGGRDEIGWPSHEEPCKGQQHNDATQGSLIEEPQAGAVGVPNTHEKEGSCEVGGRCRLSVAQASSYAAVSIMITATGER